MNPGHHPTWTKCALLFILIASISLSCHRYEPSVVELPVVEVARVQVWGQPTDVTEWNGIVYVASDRMGINVVDCTVPTAPVLVEDGWRDLGNFAIVSCLVIPHDSLLLALEDISTGSGLHALQVPPGDRTHTIYRQTYQSTYPVHATYSRMRDTTFIFVATRGHDGLFIFYNPDLPETTGQWGTLSFWNSIRLSAPCYDVAILDTFAIVADGVGGVVTINVADPSLPIELATAHTAAETRALVIKDGYAFVANGRRGLCVIDERTPDAPRIVGTWNPNVGNALDIVISGDLAFVACGYEGLACYGIADPESPVYLGSYVVSYALGVGAGTDGTIYVCDRDYGLLVMRPR